MAPVVTTVAAASRRDGCVFVCVLVAMTAAERPRDTSAAPPPTTRTCNCAGFDCSMYRPSRPRRTRQTHRLPGIPSLVECDRMGTVLDSYCHGTYSWTAHRASAHGTSVTRSVRPHLLRVNKRSPTDWLVCEESHLVGAALQVSRHY